MIYNFYTKRILYKMIAHDRHPGLLYQNFKSRLRITTLPTRPAPPNQTTLYQVGSLPMKGIRGTPRLPKAIIPIIRSNVLNNSCELELYSNLGS